MGGVYRRKDSAYPWWGWWRDTAGKRRAKALGLTKDQAQRALAIIVGRELDARNGVSAASAAPTLEEFGERYLTDHARPFKRSWKDDEQRLRKHLLPTLGRLRLDQITPERANALVADMRRRGKSAATCNRVLALLRKMLRCAEEWGAIDRVPIRRFRLQRETSDGFRYVEKPEDVARLLERVRSAEPDKAALVAFLVYTGARRSEAMQLRWEDVDLSGGYATIRRGGASGTTKSGKARTIPLHPELRRILVQLAVREGRRAGPVFLTVEGHAFTANSRLHEAVARACRAITIPVVTVHDLRHTFASHFVMSGGDARTLQYLLGHSSLSVTERYMHLSPSHMTAQLGRLQYRAADAPATTRATTATGEDPPKRR